MPRDLDIDLDVIEKVATVIALVGIADLCTELATSLRDQRRRRPRELEPAPAPATALDFSPLFAAQLGLAGLRYDRGQLIPVWPSSARLGSGQT